MTNIFTVAHTTLPSPKLPYLKKFATKFLSQGRNEPDHSSKNNKKFRFRGMYQLSFESIQKPTIYGVSFLIAIDSQ